MPERLRAILVGAGTRAKDFYAPLCQMLTDDIDIELVGVWSRSEEKARALGEQCDVPWQTDLEQLVRQTQPHFAIVSVSGQVNGTIGRQVLELGLHALLETPITLDLDEADEIITVTKAKGLKLEVAEQCYRWPMQRIRLELIQAGVFGRVFTAYNDFLSNGYHGVSLIRAYLGFDNPVVRVQGASAQFMTAPHHAWFTGTTSPREEVWQHGILHFADGRLGHAHFTNMWYDSALRWQRSMRFFAEKGMALGDELTTLSPDGKHPQPIRIERRTQYVRGGYSLSEIVAHSEPQVVWRNRFAGHVLDDDHIAVADCLMSLVQAIHTNGEPEYGAAQARHDCAVALAIKQSAENSGIPVEVTYG